MPTSESFWPPSIASSAGRSNKSGIIESRNRAWDIFNISVENCVSFLDPLFDSWDVDLATFAIEIVLNKRLAPGDPKKFAFVEMEAGQPVGDEPGLTEFLGNPSLNIDATPEEIEFLKRLRFRGQRPTALYYYRELQNLRDPVHFRESLSDSKRKTRGN